MIVERKDLVEGVNYFMDARRTDKGVFKGREGDTIFFDCDKRSDYLTSLRKGKEGLTPFADQGEGFEEVLIGDDLTEDNIKLINSLENN